MSLRIAGPGQNLPLPSTLYPAVLRNGAPYPENTNSVSLAAGQALPVPAGEWLVGLGAYSCIQYYDPITLSWRTGPIGEAGLAAQMHYVRSDGQNVRVANLTGCVIGALITATGGGWAQSSTAISASAGNSTWQPIVGGALSTTVSISAAGAGYGMAPIVVAPAPAAPGIPATFSATISSGTVSAITTVNQGAGYTGRNVALTIIPNPADPNLLAGNSITAAAATVPVVGGTSSSGSLTGVICTDPGAPLSALPALSITGAGSGVTLAPLWLVTAQSLSVSAAGTGYSAVVLGSSVGGAPGLADTWTNPTFDLSGFIPRPIQAKITSTAGALATGAPAGTYDRGLFLLTQAGDAPSTLLISNAAPTTVGTLVATMGSVGSTILLQQL